MISSSDSPRALDRFLAGAGGILLGLFALPVMIPDYPRAVGALLAVYGAASLVWLGAVWRVVQSQAVGPQTLRLVVVFALLFRVVVVFQAPIQDDDLYRYIWDGRMTWHGVNPYQYAPADDALSAYRDPLIFPYISFSYVPTIYPPLTQFAFALVVGLFGETLLAMKLAWTTVDILVIVTTIALLRAARIAPARVIVYAWAPLTIKEVAGSGHMDVFPILLTLLAVLWAGRRPWLGASALGAAVAAKLYPVLLVPLFLRWFRARALLIPVIIVLAAVPFLSVPLGQAARGLVTYGTYWMFNPGLFDLLQRGLSLMTSHHILAAKLLAGIAVILAILWRVRHRDGTMRDLCESVVWILAFTLLLTPTADPWYLLWLLPFLCVHPNPGLLAWMGLSVLSYGFYYAHADIPWLRLIEYTPVFILLLWPLLIRRLSRTRAGIVAGPDPAWTPTR